MTYICTTLYTHTLASTLHYHEVCSFKQIDTIPQKSVCVYISATHQNITITVVRMRMIVMMVVVMMVMMVVLMVMMVMMEMMVMMVMMMVVVINDAIRCTNATEEWLGTYFTWLLGIL